MESTKSQLSSLQAHSNVLTTKLATSEDALSLLQSQHHMLSHTHSLAQQERDFYQQRTEEQQKDIAARGEGKDANASVFVCMGVGMPEMLVLSLFPNVCPTISEHL